MFDPAQFTDAAGAALLRTDLFLSTNSPCPGGQCDAVGVCKTQTEDITGAFVHSITAINQDAVEAWMRSNIVGAVIVFSGVLWLVVGLVLYVHDQRRLSQLQEEAVHRFVSRHDHDRDHGRRLSSSAGPPTLAAK